MKTRWWSLALILVWGSLSASANQLLPGSSGSPDTFTLGYSYSPPNGQPVRTVLATSGFLTWTDPSNSAFTGMFYEQVESDPANVFCAGCLDFIFQFENLSSNNESLAQVTATGFQGVQTDVGYDTLSVGSGTLCGPDDNGFCSSGLSGTTASTVSRSGDGSALTFSGLNLKYFDATVDFVVETDATTYNDPTTIITGSLGDSAMVESFGPIGGQTPVPEPSTAVLLLGAGVLGLFIHSRSQRVIAGSARQG